jgi:hypothetical protein
MNSIFMDFVRENREMMRKFAVCLVIMLAIHMIPKPRVPDSSFRFFLTVGYFAAALAALRIMGKPREEAVREFVKKRFRDESDENIRSAERIGHRANKGMNILVSLATVLAASVGLSVLSIPGIPWVDLLVPFHGLFEMIAWASFIGLLLFPYYYSGGLIEIQKLAAQLGEEMELGHRGGTVGKEPLQVVSAKRFNAAGIGWNWDELRRSVLVLGETGSGKTWCVLNTLLDGLISSASPPWFSEPCGALILDPKGDFRDKVKNLCTRLGRSNDYVEIDPSQSESVCWNPLDSSDDEFEVAERFAAVMSGRDAEASKGDAFWGDSAKKFLTNAITLLRLTGSSAQPPNFEDLYNLAVSYESIVQRCQQLDLNSKDELIDNCLAFFSNEWFQYASETRTGITGHISNMLFPFLHPTFKRAFGGKSGVHLSQILDEGKIVYFHIPIATRHSMSKIICTLAKLEFYNEVKKPNRLGKSRPSIFFCDEFHNFFSTTEGRGDADMFSLSRQSNHVNVVACQSRSSMEKAAPRKEVVNNLLGNVGIKIFLRNSEEETNEWASKLFGERIAGSTSISSSQGAGKFRPPGAGGVSSGEQRVRRIPPEKFTKLVSPSPGSDIQWSESIIQITGSEADGAVIQVKPEFKYCWRGHNL